MKTIIDSSKLKQISGGWGFCMGPDCWTPGSPIFLANPSMFDPWPPCDKDGCFEW